MDQRELQLVGPLVAVGALPQEEANLALRKWQELGKAGKQVSLLVVLVKMGLLTRTQALVLADEPLEKHQPFEEYRLLRRVGEGGMAVVYEATYLPLDARVALKILKTEFCLRENFRLRFKRESGILMHLDHENIVDGREYATADGIDYCAMGFVNGISILDLVEKGEPLDEGLALHVACQVGSALEHMRESGVVHRDIKPDNFILDEDGTLRIIDLGLARLLTGMREDTGEETTVGTVEYMSPEQCRGSQVDIRSDIYSLGVSLFQMITGELPFTGNQQEVMYGHVRQELEFSVAQRNRISAPVQFVLKKTMAKDPQDRYQTPRELVDDLRAVAGEIIDNRGPVPRLVSDHSAVDAPIALKSTPKPRFVSSRSSRAGERPSGKGKDGRKRRGKGRRLLERKRRERARDKDGAEGGDQERPKLRRRRGGGDAGRKPD